MYTGAKLKPAHWNIGIQSYLKVRTLGIKRSRPIAAKKCLNSKRYAVMADKFKHVSSPACNSKQVDLNEVS